MPDASGKFRARDYYNDKLDEDTRVRFDALFERMAREGIRNKQRFEWIDGPIGYFKVDRHRITCFEEEDGRMLLVSGILKKTDKDTRSRREINTALRLRDDYLKRKGAHDEHTRPDTDRHPETSGSGDADP
ncbi:MAG: hypothetical protein ACRDK4_08555 [Solirubrobacteraceae bacterium]